MVEDPDWMGKGTVSNRTSGRRRRVCGKLILIFVGLASGLALCEIGLFALGINYPVFEKYDSERGIALRPFASGWYQSEGRAFIEINSLGYRDEEHEVQKPVGAFRIAILGDSFAEARQVEIQHTFWKLMEDQLQEKTTPGSSIEVLNFGVGSYGTTEALLTFEKDVVKFSPDLVLLMFYCGNDMINNSRILSRRIRGEEFRPFYDLKRDQLVLNNSFSTPNATFLKKRAILAAGRLRTFQLINNYLKQQKQARINKKTPSQRTEPKSKSRPYDPWFMEPIDKDWKEAWTITEKLILRLKRATEVAGSRFGLVTASMVGQVHPDKQHRIQRAASLGIEDLFYNERRLAKHGMENGYAVIPLAPTLQQYVDETGVYLHGFENTSLGSGHWNEEGHKQAARIIVNQLLNQGLMKPAIDLP